MQPIALLTLVACMRTPEKSAAGKQDWMCMAHN